MASQGTGARSFYGRLTRRRLNLHLKVISVLNRQSVQTFRHIIGTVANGRTDDGHLIAASTLCTRL